MRRDDVAEPAINSWIEHNVFKSKSSRIDSPTTTTYVIPIIFYFWTNHDRYQCMKYRLRVQKSSTYRYVFFP